MKAKFCSLVLLAAITFGISSGVPLNSDEEKARKFAEDASKSLFSIHDKMTEVSLSSETEKLSSFLSVMETVLTETEAMREIVRNASVFDQTNFKDTELNYAFKKIKKIADVAILGGERLFATLAATGNLEILASNKDIEGYKNDSIKLAYFPDIRNIYATSNNTEEMKYYWNAWRKQNDEFAMSNFLGLVTDIKDAANLTGISATEFWMKDYNMTQMDAVMERITPVYQQIHAFIRYQLNTKYGNAVVNDKGLIPEHLFQQVLAQIWTNGSVIEEFFPYKDLPQYDEVLVNKNYDALKIFKMADKFYESMGFEPITDNYWGNQFKMKTSEDGGDCRVRVLALTPKVFMLYCNKMDFRTFLRAHGYMAQIHMAMEKSHLPAYYSDSYNLEYALGEAVILSASTPKYLNKVGLLTSPEFSDEVLMSQLLRQGIQSMLNIPVYYVHTKVMADLFEGKIEMTELNKHYWKLMEKYVGVEPPSDRASNTFDFPFEFYLELNENAQARKFMSEVLSYQFYMKLCSITDQYPNGQIQNCDFSGSKVAGDAIKNMIKLGSSKPLPEVLSALLPQNPELNSQHLLVYYSPAFRRLVVANRMIKANIGWTQSDKKIESVKLPEKDD